MTQHDGTRRRSVLKGALVASLAFALPQAAVASDYPSRTVTIIVPFAAGGITDGIARMVAARLEQQTGQTFLVDNRGGAGGTIGAAAVAQSAPDGYTLLMTTTGVVTITPHLREIPYDPFEDLAAVAMMAFSNGVLAVHPSVPAESVQELVDFARANPNELFFASGGVGTIAHLFGEMFSARAEVEMEHVPFSGSGPALTDVIAGRAQVIFDTGAVNPVREGQLRGLAVLGAEESPLLPGLPTLQSTGYGEEMLSWFGIMAPAGTPDAVVATLSAEIEAALATESLRDDLAAAGITARFEGPQEFAASIVRDHGAFGEVIDRLGIEVD